MNHCRFCGFHVYGLPIHATRSAALKAWREFAEQIGEKNVAVLASLYGPPIVTFRACACCADTY